MSSEMVERVARAISHAFREEGSHWDGKWESDAEHHEFLRAARAVISAMREPTEEMLAAGGSGGLSHRDGSPNPHAADACWRLMIDAALKP